MTLEDEENKKPKTSFMKNMVGLYLKAGENVLEIFDEEPNFNACCTLITVFFLALGFVVVPGLLYPPSLFVTCPVLLGPVFIPIFIRGCKQIFKGSK